MSSLVTQGLDALQQYANRISNQHKALVTSGEVSEEKRDQPSFLTSLVSNVIEDWNVYNDCKDREDSENPSKPSTVETWVNEGLNAYANYAKNVNGRKKGPSFIEGNLYEKQSAKPSTVETWVNEGLNAYAKYAKNVGDSRRKKGSSFIEANLYEKQSAKQPSSPLISFVNQGLATYTNYVQNVNADLKERQQNIKERQENIKEKSRLPSLRQGLSNYKKYAKKVWKSASSIQAFGTNSIDRQFGFTFVPILAFAAMAVVSGTAFGIQTIEDEENRQKQAASNSDSEVTVSCSVTVQGLPSATRADDPNPTVTCYFYDLTNDEGKTAAIVDVPIGTTLGVSPVTYPVGSLIRVEAVWTSQKEPYNTKVEQQQFVAHNMIVPLNIPGDNFPANVLDGNLNPGDPLQDG